LQEEFESKIIGLSQENAGDESQLLEAFRLILKIFNKYNHAAYYYSSIVLNPQEQKFRMVKASNPVLRQKLFCITEIENLLLAVGYLYVLATKARQLFRI